VRDRTEKYHSWSRFDFKIGEPQASIARSYGVDVDTIKRVGA
jgi:hypothetical protein